MDGISFTIPGYFDATDLPILYPDPGMNAGSIFLVDFSNPNMNSTVIPTDGSKITNIARENALAIIGTGTLADYDPAIVNTAVAGAMQLEFTNKKGLHCIVSQVNDVVSGNDFGINLPPNIVSYIRANLSHNFYISAWDRKTRLYSGSLSDTPRPDFTLGVDDTNNYVTMLAQEGFYNTTANKRMMGRVLGNRINNIAITANGAGSPSSTYAGSKNRWGFGSFSVYASFGNNKMPSGILYRLHIIDLQLAGMTYAQADAADYAAWTTAFAAGGKFYGDTFTDPATLP